MKPNSLLIFVLLLLLQATTLLAQQEKPSTFLALSQSLLVAARDLQPSQALQQQLADASQEDLAKELKNDDAKKAFWINIYNAYVQLILTDKPEKFDNRGNFFSAKQIVIVGKNLSLDDIEHGIIRGSRSKLTLGLTKKWFVGAFERQFRVKKRDGRVHFALNCGAISCPPVAIYEASRLEEQLDLSSHKYLQANARFDTSTNEVHIPALFSWFRGDFGWKKGIYHYLEKYDILSTSSKAKIKYNKYDWTLFLGNYIEL